MTPVRGGNLPPFRGAYKAYRVDGLVSTQSGCTKFSFAVIQTWITGHSKTGDCTRCRTTNDGNSPHDTMAMWIGLGNRLTSMWERSLKLNEFLCSQFGWNYAGSEARNNSELFLQRYTDRLTIQPICGFHVINLQD